MTTFSNQQSAVAGNRHWIDSRGSDDKPSVAWFSESHLCHAFLTTDQVGLIADGLLRPDKATTKVSVKDVVKASANRDEDWVNITHQLAGSKQDGLILHLKNAVARDDFLSVLQDQAGLKKTVTTRRVPWIDATIAPILTTVSIASLIFLFYFLVPPSQPEKWQMAPPTTGSAPRFEKVEQRKPRNQAEWVQDLVNDIGPTGMFGAGFATLFIGAFVIYRRGKNRPVEQLIVLNCTPR